MKNRIRKVPVPRLRAVLLLMAAAFLLVSCGTENPPAQARDVAAAMLAAIPSPPAGRILSRDADPAGKEYLSGTLLSALFGPACRDWLGDEPESDTDGGHSEPLIGDAAVFLPTGLHPGELAVFRCTRADGAVSAAAVCENRLAALRSAWKDSTYGDLLARACVRVEGCWVLLIVADDPDAVLAAARDALRG